MNDVNGTGVQADWETDLIKRFHVIIRDHGEEFEAEIAAIDLRYVLATLQIEYHIYLSSAESITIQPVASDGE